MRATPKRVARSFEFLTSGYRQAPRHVINGAIFESHTNNMIIVRDIEVYSLCEHHLLPFYGKAHIAYIPKEGRVTGLSKLGRAIDILAKRPQVQERLTTQIAEVIMHVLKPRGCMVVIEAEHLCMQMRGVQKRGTSVITSSMLGAFRKRPETRAEFMNLIR